MVDVAATSGPERRTEMAKTTIETLTLNQINALEQEAAAAGDYLTVADCQRARGAVDDSADDRQIDALIKGAKERIVRVLNDAAARARS